MNAYDNGDVVRISATFQADGFSADPTTLLFKAKSPRTHSVTTYTYGINSELVRESAGKYHIDLNPTEAGTWQYRWEATGVAKGAESGRFYVRRANL